MNKTRKPAWIFIVNQTEGRLLQAREMPENRRQLRLRDRIENAWEEHEHQRPQPLAGKNGHTYGSFGHEQETMRRRFAQDVARWLHGKVSRLKIDRVAVLAPSRFLGELKPLWPSRLQPRINEYECGLGYLGEGELAQHPQIIQILSNGAHRD